MFGSAKHGAGVGEPREVSAGHSFLESPRWHDGRLYASDFYTGQVLVFDERGENSTLAQVPGQPSGLGFAPDGALLIVSMIDRRLLRLEADGDLTEVANLGGVASWHCNDMAVDREGRAYVGNFGWDNEADQRIVSTSLALVQPDGTVAIAAEDLVFPNGMALSGDGRTLLVAETFAARVTAFEVAADGSLSGRRPWAVFTDSPLETLSDALASEAILPDGIALDEEGALWIGDASGGAAVRVAEGGAVLDSVEVDDGAVYAVALGGPELRDLYMCVGPGLLDGDPRVGRRGRLLVHPVEVAGAAL